MALKKLKSPAEAVASILEGTCITPGRYTRARNSIVFVHELILERNKNQCMMGMGRIRC
jgi:hypothetical protein